MNIHRSFSNWICIIAALFVHSSCILVNPRTSLENIPVVEERGIWLHRTNLLDTKENLLKLLDDLKNANFTSIYIHTYFRGSVVYPNSLFLPQFDEMKDSDILSWLIPEIKNRGMRAEAWMEYGFYAFHVPDATKTNERGVFLGKYPELVAIDSDGMPYIHNEDWGDFYSLCPANPKSHELIGNLCLETLSHYPFDGLNLDRIRFPGSHFCFCNFCRENFKKDTGFNLQSFPDDSPEYQVFIKWRNERISCFMEQYTPQFRGLKPGVTVSMACLPPDMMESLSQPWNLWLEKGYIDAAMPMLYNMKDFKERVGVLMGFPHWDRIFCALDADSLKSRKIRKQIRLLKKRGATGFAFWYSRAIKDDLKKLKSGPFATPAISPLKPSD